MSVQSIVRARPAGPARAALLLLLVPLLALAPAAALAQEHGGGAAHGEEGNPLTRFDPGLLIWTVLIFLLLVALLRWKAWPPIVDALRRREEVMRSAIAEAERARAAAATSLEEQQRLLAEARREAQAMLAQSRGDAERARNELLARAREESEKVIQAGREAIEQEKRSAIQELRQTAVDLALAASTKLLRERVDDAKNRELVASYVQELERHGARPGGR